MKKVGKTTRPFRYDLNQTPYDYRVEVRNRFKGLDLIDRVPEELWMDYHQGKKKRLKRKGPRQMLYWAVHSCWKFWGLTLFQLVDREGNLKWILFCSGWKVMIKKHV